MTALDHTNGPFLNPCSRLDLSPVRPQINPVCRSPRQSSPEPPEARPGASNPATGRAAPRAHGVRGDGGPSGAGLGLPSPGARPGVVSRQAAPRPRPPSARPCLPGTEARVSRERCWPAVSSGGVRLGSGGRATWRSTTSRRLRWCRPPR